MCWDEEEEVVAKRKRLRKVALESDEETPEDRDREKGDGEKGDREKGDSDGEGEMDTDGQEGSQKPLENLTYNAEAAAAAGAGGASPGHLPLGSHRRVMGFPGDSSSSSSSSSSTSGVSYRCKLHEVAARTGSLYLRRYVDDFELYSSTFSFPPWLHPASLRDAEGRLAVSDPEYNPQTLWTPPANHQLAKEHRAPHFTPGMQQYWEIKRQHHDKIVLFKMGRFYELFYSDACIAHAICDLKWMGSSEKPHCGFPEQSLQHHSRALVNAGFKVVVVEQMETPKELEKRKSAEGTKDKAVKREACEIFTAGSIPHPEMLSADARLLLVLAVSTDAADRPQKQQQQQQQEQQQQEEGEEEGETEPYSFGAVLIDVPTNKIYLNTGGDNASWGRLRQMFAQTQPIEIVYSASGVSPAVLSIIKKLPCLPQLSPLHDFPDTLKAMQLIDTYIRPRCSSSNSSSSSSDYCLSECERSPCLSRAVGAACLYLQQLLLDSKVLPVATYVPLNNANCLLLSLDAKALTQLEVLASQEGDTSRSLLGCIDSTVTAGGKRLLRRWVVAPLRCTRTINSRLDAVTWLLQHEGPLSLLRKTAAALPDVERLAARCLSQGQQRRRQAVYFDDVHQKQLKAFLSLLDSFDSIERVATTLASELEKETAAAAAEAGDAAGAAAAAAADGGVWPHRLWQLCASRDKGGDFPLLQKETKRLRDMIDVKQEGTLTPKKGLVPEYDSTSAEIASCQQQLEKLLKDLQAATGQPSLKYTHTKFKYEVECPENISKEILRRLEADITSTRKGFIRFRTPTICELAEQLDELELALNDSFYPFRSRLTGEFSQAYADTFGVSIHCMHELDVIQSLATFARTHPGPEMTRPKFLPPSEEEDPVLLLRNARHPMAEKLTDCFVPNDVLLNVPSSSNSSSNNSSNSSSSSSNVRTLLITGPNMGGKSTLLRQTALCAILAQIGSYVPASECVLTPIDRIFTRLGAEDYILQGSSTFFVELSDVAELTTHGTRYSLALIDELGRGTSTSDGVAIALATAEYITDNIRCRSLFATHYHMLCYELRQHPGVLNAHLGAAVEEETVSFRYKVREGICPNSHGILVAKLAGIPQAVLDCAAEQSQVLQKQAAQQQRDARIRSVAVAILRALASKPRDLECMYTRLRAELLSDAEEQQSADTAAAAALSAAAAAAAE